MSMRNYATFLDIIMPVIDRKFEHQKEYLACSKGCAKCCKTASMPFSQIEFDYLIEGFNTLDDNKKTVVSDNMKKLVSSVNEEACPFLIDDVCSVYKYRGLICRTFGLLLINDEGEYTIPFCVNDGLNYSKIYDFETKKLSPEKLEKLGYKNEPMYHTLSRSQIFGLELAKDLNIKSGESKPLKEWIKEYYKKRA